MPRINSCSSSRASLNWIGVILVSDDSPTPRSRRSIPHHSCEEKVSYLLRNAGAAPAVIPQLPAITNDAQLEGKS
jgi:hypothetical protein